MLVKNINPSKNQPDFRNIQFSSAPEYYYNPQVVAYIPRQTPVWIENMPPNPALRLEHPHDFVAPACYDGFFGYA